MSLETRAIKPFWRDIPGFCRDIPAVPKKFEKKSLCSIFVPKIFADFCGLSCLFLKNKASSQRRFHRKPQIFAGNRAALRTSVTCTRLLAKVPHIHESSGETLARVVSHLPRRCLPRMWVAFRMCPIRLFSEKCLIRLLVVKWWKLFSSPTLWRAPPNNFCVEIR